MTPSNCETGPHFKRCLPPLEEVAYHILSQEETHQQPVPRPTKVPCTELERLNRIYLDAVTKVFGAGKVVPNTTSSDWRAATEMARSDCRAALAELKRHKKEHGC
jgi:hypothetical protein